MIGPLSIVFQKANILRKGIQVMNDFLNDADAAVKQMMMFSVPQMVIFNSKFKAEETPKL